MCRMMPCWRGRVLSQGGCSVVAVGRGLQAEAPLVLQGSGGWSACAGWEVGVVGGEQPAGGGPSQPLQASPAPAWRRPAAPASEKMHACPTCGKTFGSSKDCRRHAVIHTGAKPFKCPYCPHRANVKYNLTKHVLVRHKKLPPPPMTPSPLQPQPPPPLPSQPSHPAAHSQLPECAGPP